MDKPLNIIEFIQHPDVLNDQSLSAAQMTCLKSVYGLLLTDQELEIYRRGTGRETPYARSGILWEEFQQRGELAFPVWQATTFEMNPTLTPKMLEGELRRSEEKYTREYLAQFTDSISGWVAPEILDPCIVRSRRELPRQPDVDYVAAIDPASRHNDFALAILHQVPDGTIVVDRVAHWTGTKTAPLQFEYVLGQIKQILDSYEIGAIIGDQYYADAIKQHLQKLGIYYKISNFGASTRSQIFSNLKHLMVQGKIQLLDDAELLRQLRNLREKKTSRGQIDIRPTGGMKDDKAVVLALAASEVSRRPEVVLGISPGIVDFTPSRARLSMIPGNCPYEAECRNCPRCMDEGRCLGFEDEGFRFQQPRKIAAKLTNRKDISIKVA